jgi:hypothetical protein
MELEWLAEGRVVDDDPAAEEERLLEEQEEIEFRLGSDEFERPRTVARTIPADLQMRTASVCLASAYWEPARSCVAERPSPLTKLLVTVGQGRRRAKSQRRQESPHSTFIGLCFPTGV